MHSVKRPISRPVSQVPEADVFESHTAFENLELLCLAEREAGPQPTLAADGSGRGGAARRTVRSVHVPFGRGG